MTIKTFKVELDDLDNAKSEVIRELLEFPIPWPWGRPGSRAKLYDHDTVAKFDRFADFMGEMYTRYATKARDWSSFRKRVQNRIRNMTERDWRVAMGWAIQDVGRVDELLTVKRLCFG